MSTKYIKTAPVFWSEPANRLLVVRVFVTAFIAGVAVVFGTLSYTILKSYEKRIGDARYNVIANSALDAMTSDINEKSDVVLSLAKNMAYFEPDATDWPNVAMPGFYDSNTVLKRVAALDDLIFLPLVQPAHLPNFETFMYNYFDTEPAIPAGAGISPSGRGVYAYNSSSVNGTYHDTTGVATQYQSPNDILVPITQLLFNSYLTPVDLALNIHSVPQAGLALDAVIACSQTADYSTASGSCGRASSFMSLPFNATAPVQSLHTMIFQPVYLNQNASQLVGFTAGGFDWLAQVSGMFADYRSGIKIVVTNGASAVTYSTTGSDVRVASADDSHDSDYDSYQRAAHFFSSSEGGSASTTDASTAEYSVYVYPSDEFFASQRTDTPLWACIGSVILIILCYAKFIIYDRVVMRESTAKAAVLETKRRFVRFISHEIRTPLNAVHLGLEALTTEVRKGLEQILVAQSEGTGAKLGDLADMLRSWLELSVEMMGNSESAVDVLNDLLNYDKIEMGTLRLDFSAVPIWDIIQTTTVAFLPQAKQRNIHMTLDSSLHSEVDIEDGAGKKFVCVGDAARLAQVMRNLVSNAIKFTPNNGCIDIGVERIEQGIPHFHMVTPDDCSKLLEQPRAGSIRISVTDSGAGLSEAQLAKISTEGVQFNANELQAGKGSGLGMFITRGIIEQHGGKLTVASGGIGAGTTFAVELPLFHRTISPLWRSASSRFGAHRRVSPEALYDLNLASSADTEKSSSYSSKPAPRQILVGGPAGPRRILVVDDASSNRKMLMRILTANGYACEQAEDGKQAIEMVRASIESGLGFYAITMDYEMPVMNGPTATKKLREMGCTIPIIGVTGNLLPDDVAFYKAQGANDVLAKPLSLAKFEEFMRGHTMLVRRQVPRSGAGNEESFSEEDC